MRLLHFNGKICKNMPEIIPSIKATYQMEQEFYPYLDITFLTNDQHDEQNTGIVLQTKNNIIKRYYDFKDKKDLEDLRTLIWDNLEKEKNITEVDGDEQNNDRKVGLNKVIIGWGNVVQEHKNHIYPGIQPPYLNLPVDSELRSLNRVFRLNPNDKQTKQTCKLQRYQECTDNYAQATPEFKRCVDEVNWLCENGYPNKKLQLHTQYVNSVRGHIYDDLENNNGYVGKRQFDDIIDAGLFYDTGLRSGNIYADYKKYQNVENFEVDSNWKMIVCFIIIIFIVIGYKYVNM